MIPRRPKPLCAICADREADTSTDWECASGATRTIVACWPCLSPVPDPPEEYEPADLTERFAPSAESRRNTTTRDAIFAAIAHAAVPVAPADIARAVGAPCPGTARDRTNRHQWRPYQAVLACLSRAVKRGELVGVWVDPEVPGKGRLYSLPPKESRRAS